MVNLKSNNLDYDAPIEDIILTGSLANYNYNEYSDLDVHIIIDFKKIDENIELVKKAVDGDRFLFNLRHNIKIKGHDVELYIQDINEPHIASGVYSLTNNRWIRKPIYNEPSIDEKLLEFKYLKFKNGIEKLDELSDKEMTPEIAANNYRYATEYKNKITKGRKEGLAKDGEFSIENLIFKKLRNDVSIEKIIDVIGKFYDKIYSQN